MKKSMLLTVILIGLAGIVVTAQAQLVNSVHDLSTGSTATFKTTGIKSTNQDQTCVFCHTPHTTSTLGLLWNRNSSSATYNPYKVGSTPGDASKRCLSCHDGTVAVNSLLVGSANNAVKIDTTQVSTGTNLTNDHPVGVTLTVGTYYQNPSTYAQLVSGKVECSSCHDPHNTTSVTHFLRTANTSSRICTDCHKK